MIDLNERCPICNSSSFNYYFNSYGVLVKKCDGCGHFITTDNFISDKTIIKDKSNYAINTNNII